MGMDDPLPAEVAAALQLPGLKLRLNTCTIRLPMRPTNR